MTFNARSLTRSVAIDPNLDTDNNPFHCLIEAQLSLFLPTRDPSKWEAYYNELPDTAPQVKASNQDDDDRNPEPPPPGVIYARNIPFENLEEELNKAQEEIKNNKDDRKPFWWLQEECYNQPMKEPQVLPPQIKNKNMEQILDEYYLANPPTDERSVPGIPEEYYDHIDARLEWLYSSVEEADIDEKNNETFGLI